MNILIAAAEAWPYIKVGGLGDVVGALPKALKKCGADARIIMPQYRDIPVLLKKGISHKADFYINLGWRRQYCGINQVEYNGSICYFIDNEYYFGRNGVYGHYDDGERFAFFSKAVLEALPFLDFKPDIIHCNDWHTAFIPVLLEKQYKSRDFYSHIKTLYTIHNLSYQGVMPSGTLMNLLGIGTDEKIEYYGNESISKGGLIYSDGISAVSPSYAREIQESSMGEGLDGVLRKRSDKLKGILNGIDYEVYNPENDQYIFQCYCKSHIDRRKANKLELQRELELQEKEDVPLIGMVSRLVSQKGFQLVEQVLEDILAMDVQLVVLGSGEKKYEDMFINAACMHKDMLLFP
jgi:starch synthase